MNRMKNTSVLQDWLVEIPIRMQSTLILGLRGNDTYSAPNVKKMARWLRGLAFKPGNPENAREFMGEAPERIVDRGPTAKEFDFVTQHYFSHLLHAMEVVAYRHPDLNIAAHAFQLFSDMCCRLHLPVEEAEDFEMRLGTIEWPGGQPDTFEEAVERLNKC